MHLTYLTTYLPSKLCFSNTLKDDERGGECEECKSVCESYSEEERECDRKRDSERGGEVRVRIRRVSVGPTHTTTTLLNGEKWVCV